MIACAAVAAHAQDRPLDDWKAAFAAAKQEKKLVFVDYFATWCRPCHEMEEHVFPLADVKEQMAKFVVVTIDVDRSPIARAHAVAAMPTYVIYDARERELMRITGWKPAQIFSAALAEVNSAAPQFAAADELDQQAKPIDAAFARANAFMSLRLGDQARVALKDARKEAEKSGKPAVAQVAQIQDAFTFALENNPRKSIKLLENILKSPLEKQAEQLAWLTLGQVQRAAKNAAAARDCFEHVKSICSPDEAAYRDADAALRKLQP
ncbi:MAG TPA: thioredoxin domain-containing protein [Thermoanaerobaculia bacterium]|nr:thioredoxin domain-containing protein [Thermoanaerobaculia bacterium]